MSEKIDRTEWQPQNGVAVMISQNFQIAVPIAAFSFLCAEARRYASGAAAKSHSHLTHGQMHFAEHHSAKTYDVGLVQTTDGDKVSLVLDRGLDTQIGFAIDPEHARELSAQLRQFADQAAKIRPYTN